VLGRAEAKSTDSSRAAVAGAPADAERGFVSLTDEERKVWRGGGLCEHAFRKRDRFRLCGGAWVCGAHLPKGVVAIAPRGQSDVAVLNAGARQ